MAGLRQRILRRAACARVPPARIVELARARAVLLSFGLLCAAGRARAQMAPATPPTMAVGDWQLTPRVDLRVRGEYRRDPVEVGGLTPAGTPTPSVRDLVVVATRARLGIGVERGPLRAVVTLQDARVWGSGAAGGLVGAAPASGLGAVAPFGSTSAYEAFGEVHGASTRRPSFVRIGRQPVRWGDGLLIGTADWSPTGRALDAARAVLTVGDGELEILASILDAPRPLGVPWGDARGPVVGGAQLYGVRAAWALDPLLSIELAALARVARSLQGVPSTSAFVAARERGETYTGSLRMAGERGLVAYAVEGAAQVGDAPALGLSRLAYAAAGHLTMRFDRLVTTPWLRLGGAYASGGRSGGGYAQFDPLLPDVHATLGALDVFALSNLVEAHARVTSSPGDDVRLALEYRYARLARASGEWIHGYVGPIGAGDPRAGAELGHELDLAVTWQPWPALALHAGGSSLLLGDAARAIMAGRQRGRLTNGSFAAADVVHAVWVQATLRVP